MRMILVAVVLVACNDKEVADSGGPPPLSTGEQEDTAQEEEVCFGAPPNINTFTVENTGLASEETNEPEVPTLTFSLNVSDNDGDLAPWSLSIWYDQLIDQELDPQTAGVITSSGSLGDECAAPSGTIEITLYMGGGDLSYNTLYEWGAVLTDARGMESGMAVQTYETPDEDGS